jgi:flagellar protein FlaJ
MLDDLKQSIGSLPRIVDTIEKHKTNLINLNQELSVLDQKLQTKKINIDQFNKSVKQLLDGKSEPEYLEIQEKKILSLLKEIDNIVGTLNKNLETKQILKQETSVAPTKEKTVEDKESRYVKQLISTKKKKKEEVKIPDYILYNPSKYGKISNRFVERITISLTKKYPEFFTPLYKTLKSSSINLLSKTYISMSIFSTIISFFISIFIFLALFNKITILNIINSFILGIFFSTGVFFFFYYYPTVSSNHKKRKIKNDLPFVIVQMAAIAGSGANPITIFNFVLGSKEFKGLESEIKKIVNYVNLFGYSLTTSLRLVATTTPSREFKEFLNGLVTTIETGGNLKEYLKAKADEAITTYRIDRKKYVSTLSTYSDIYTGILIAAPLLFFAAIAIIQVLGGKIFGIEINVMANFAVFGLIPLLNIFFFMFLNIIQPEI